MVGIGAAREYAGLDVGDRVELRDGSWTIVGHFSAAGGASESEVWMDLPLAQSTFRREGAVSSLRVRVAPPGAVRSLGAAIEADPRLGVSLISENDFFAAQSESRAELIETFAYFIASIMALGAIAAALNATYAAVSTRTVEIATLRALGFRGPAIVCSVLAETILLASLGGALGGAIVYGAFDGYATSTLNEASFPPSQVAFGFAVTTELLGRGLGWAIALGCLGGLLPALRAARIPITTGLRGE